LPVRFCRGLRSQGLRPQGLRPQGLRLRPVGLDAARNRVRLRSFGCGRLALERRGEEILSGYQDDGGKRDGIEDIVLVVHREAPLPSSKCGLRRKISDRQPGQSILCIYQRLFRYPSLLRVNLDRIGTRRALPGLHARINTEYGSAARRRRGVRHPLAADQVGVFAQPPNRRADFTEPHRQRRTRRLAAGLLGAYHSR